MIHEVRNLPANFLKLRFKGWILVMISEEVVEGDFRKETHKLLNHQSRLGHCGIFLELAGPRKIENITNEDTAGRSAFTDHFRQPLPMCHTTRTPREKMEISY